MGGPLDGHNQYQRPGEGDPGKQTQKLNDTVEEVGNNVPHRGLM